MAGNYNRGDGTNVMAPISLGLFHEKSELKQRRSQQWEKKKVKKKFEGLGLRWDIG